MGSEKGHRRNLDQRLHNSGIEASTEPLVAWHQLRQIEGGRATVIDLYRLVSGPRGLQPHELPLERPEFARSAMPFVWTGFTLTAGSERYDPIRVVDYDPSWPARFQGWRKRLSRELGQAAVRIEHVGSTAVADLAAKPVVDIQVSVVDITDEDSYVRSVERSGLQLRSRDGLHRYFRPASAAPRDVHRVWGKPPSVSSDWRLLSRRQVNRQGRARRSWPRMVVKPLGAHHKSCYKVGVGSRAPPPAGQSGRPRRLC